MVVTLRNGHEVETRLEERKQGVREPTANPRGSRADMVSKGKKVTPLISSFAPAMVSPYVPKVPFPTCLDTPSPFSKKKTTMDEMLEVFK